MKKWAKVKNGRIVEITESDKAPQPEQGSTFQEVKDNAKVGDAAPPAEGGQAQSKT